MLRIAHAARSCLLGLLLFGCYEVHWPGDAQPASNLEQGDDDGTAPSIRRRESFAPPGRPEFERPVLPPIECDVEPTPDCVNSFPRVMIVMDASSSMLAGRRPGRNNWDKARYALAGNPDAPDPEDDGYVLPAFARKLEVRGNLVTMEDVFHLGLTVFNAAETQRLVLQYAPCASDNIRWAMDPYVSCEPPGCTDPYEGEPIWTEKNSDVDRDPPFVQTTMSYMPPCNPGGTQACVGTMYNTYTAEGLEFARDNIAAYREDSGGFEVSSGTRFANILITDGATAPDSSPGPMLERLLADGVPTYVIGLEPRGGGIDPEDALEVLDLYARLGGTQLATLIEADGQDIADAFAATVTRIIDEIGTDPCCQPYHCSNTPEPPAPEP